MENIYQDAVALLRAGKSFAYVTITQQDGSAPRAAGSKMLVLQDEIRATIGGGLMEAQVIEAAREKVLKTHGAMKMVFDLSGTQAAMADFICGGSCELLLCYADAQNPQHLLVFEEAEKLYRQGGTGWLITVLDMRRESAKLCLSDGRRLVGEYDAKSMIGEDIMLAPSRIAIHGTDDPAVCYITDPVHTGGVVYLFGAGHVSVQVARITNLLEFQTVVIDDRAEFLTPARFPGCQLLQPESMEHLPDLPIDLNSYLLIITRGHTHDETVLRWALGKGAGYIGMIGSIQKRDRIYLHLRQQGIDESRLQAVHSPIGLPIGGQTPAEIAVSIAAELVQVRSRKNAW